MVVVDGWAAQLAVFRIAQTVLRKYRGTVSC
jgi:hypothetical protein